MKYRLKDLDHRLERTIKEKEKKHNCLLFLIHDDEEVGTWMSGIYLDTNEIIFEVKVSDDRGLYTTDIGIRKYFNPEL